MYTWTHTVTVERTKDVDHLLIGSWHIIDINIVNVYICTYHIYIYIYIHIHRRVTKTIILIHVFHLFVHPLSSPFLYA